MSNGVVRGERRKIEFFIEMPIMSGLVVGTKAVAHLATSQ